MITTADQLQAGSFIKDYDGNPMRVISIKGSSYFNRLRLTAKVDGHVITTLIRKDADVTLI